MSDLMADDMRCYAVVKNIEIIGETTNMLTPEFRDAHSQTPWKMIVGMRNHITHEYFQVSTDVIREVITQDLPELKEQIQTYLDE